MINYLVRKKHQYTWLTSKYPLNILVILILLLSACTLPNKPEVSVQIPSQASIKGMLPVAASKVDAFTFSSFLSQRGHSIRYGKVLAEKPKGTIIITPGQSEFIEIYFELIKNLNEEGYNVWAMDWSGQGGSQHEIVDTNRAINNFNYDYLDLRDFITEVVLKDKGPIIIFAHSMGAHIALRLIAEESDIVDGAILNSPMVTINTGLFPHDLSTVLARLIASAGFGWWYAPGNAAWEYKPYYVSDDNKNTSDFNRGVWKENWRLKEPHTRKSYGVTFEWLRNYAQSREKLVNSVKLRNTPINILMTIALDDVMVLPNESIALCTTIPKCDHILYNKSKHEIYLEVNEIREQWVSDIVGWMSER